MTIDRELLNEFIWTTREELQRIEESLLLIESTGSDVTTVNRIYRMFHSVKGGAGLCGIHSIEAAAHACESLLAPCRDQADRLDGICIATLLQKIDAIKSGLADLSTGSTSTTLKKISSALAAAMPLVPGAAPVVAASAMPAVEPAQAELSRIITELTTTRPTAPMVDEQAAQVPAQTREPLAVPPPGAAPAGSPPPSTTTMPAVGKPSAAGGPAAPADGGEHSAPGETTAETAVRVDITLLDRLMNLVGELVLARNRLLQVVGRFDEAQLTLAAQSINQVTSEVQEHIVRTRMQPVGNLFAKLPRLVRDLSHQLNKRIELETSGKDTGLDRTILEALRDPFTHIIRNACDHGVEGESERIAAGKPPQGKLRVRAWHEGGRVLVEIADDGRGINLEKVKNKAIANGLLTATDAAKLPDSDAFALICHPGLSTAEKVTSVSGRGVGMDVVKKNVEKLGGQIEISSVLGSGTTLRLHIPLTLAIIPVLMVRVGDQIFGVPQVSLVELVRLDDTHQVEQVRGAAVFRLRDQLLTLAYLADVLAMPRSSGPGFIAVLADGRRRFGLVVDAILDTEEIVVKPLSRLLTGLEFLAGSTIRGDGRVSLILDVTGVAHLANIDQRSEPQVVKPASALDDLDEFLVFDLGHRERFAVPLSQVRRIERHPHGDLSRVDGREVLCHDGRLMPVVRIEDHTHARAMTELQDDVHAIVIDHPSGAALLVRNVVDNRSLSLGQALPADQLDASHIGVLGALVIDGIPTVILDVTAILNQAASGARRPARPPTRSPPAERSSASRSAGSCEPAGHADSPGEVILYCEDSQFFQTTVAGYLRELGYQVEVADDGERGWQLLQQHPERYGLVLTDLEMPALDGWELIKRIRDEPRHDQLPLIALSSLKDESVRQRVMQCGGTMFLTKLDKTRLQAAITEHFPTPVAGAAP